MLLEIKLLVILISMRVINSFCFSHLYKTNKYVFIRTSNYEDFLKIIVKMKCCFKFSIVIVVKKIKINIIIVRLITFKRFKLKQR